MDIRFCVRYPYIFYSILVFSLSFGIHYTSSRETEDYKGFVGEPIILKKGWAGGVCHLIFLFSYFLCSESLSIFYSSLQLWYSLQHLINCYLDCYIRLLIGRPDRLDKVNIIFKIVLFFVKTLSLLSKWRSLCLGVVLYLIRVKAL